MRSLRIPLLAITTTTAAALALAACVPGRDNPNDPEIAPAAVLTFADAGVEGSCATSSTVVAGASVLQIERNHCLALVGTNTTDHQDPLSSMHFHFELVTTNAMLASANTFDSDGDPVVVVPASNVRALPQNAVLHWRLTATDPSGNQGIASAPVTIHDNAPAPLHYSERVVAAGGPPWDPGTSWIVPLDASGVQDPDGDTNLTYCWDRPGDAQVCSNDPRDPNFVLTVPPSTGRVTATLHVSDGVQDAVVAHSIVDVRQPPTWAIGAQLGNPPLTRLDTGRNVFPFPSVLLEPVRSGNGALTNVAAVQNNGSSYTIYTRTWPDFAAVDSKTVATNAPETLAVSPDGSALYLVLNVGNSTGIQLYPFSISPAGALTAASPSAIIPITTEGHTGHNPFATVDSLGHVWVSQTYSGVTEANPDGTVVGHWEDPASETRVLSMRERPGTNEMWFVRTPDSSTADPITIHRVVGGVETPFQLGYGHAEDFVWADSTSFWIAFDDRVALIDADVLASTGSMTLAETRSAPAPSALRLYLDPTTGEVWTLGLLAFEYDLVSPDGEVLRRVPITDFGAEPQFVDDVGLVWFYDSAAAAVVSAEVPSSNPTAASSSVSLPMDGSSDGYGGAWFATLPFITPSILQHVTMDGRLQRTITFFEDTAGNAVAMPAKVFGIRTVPGTTHARLMVAPSDATQFEAVWDVDLAKDPAVRAVVLSTAAQVQFTSAALEPSAPIPASTPFTWAIEGDPGQIGELSQTGTFTPVVTLTSSTFGAERNTVRIARSLRSNGLCMAAVDYTVFRALFIPASGAATSLLSTTVTANSTVPAVSSAPDTAATGDVCWAVVQAPASSSCSFGAATLIGWTSAGTTVGSYTVSPGGAVQSIKAIDRNRVWITVQRCDVNQNSVTDLELITNAGGTSMARRTLVPAAGTGAFVDDEVGGAPPPTFVVP